MAKEDKNVKPDLKSNSSVGLQHLSIQTRGMHDNFDEKITKLLSRNMSTLENKFDQLNYTKNTNTSTASTTKKVIENLSDAFSPSSNALPNIEEDLNSVYNYSKKYYSTLKDYETMPSMIPALVRVLNFLTNEIISPDNQSEQAFIIKSEKDHDIEIKHIRTTHSMDRELRNIINSRFRLGKQFYLVQGYNTLFSMVAHLKADGVLNESCSMSDISTLLESYTKVVKCTDDTAILTESVTNGNAKIPDTNIIKMSELDISVEYGAIAEDYKHQISSISSVLNEASSFSSAVLSGRVPKTDVTVNDFILYESILAANNFDGDITEAYINSTDQEKLNESYNGNVNKDKLIKISKLLANNKSLRRANVQNLDPARIFPLKAANRIIGYFYYEEEIGTNNTFNDLLIKNLKNAKIGKDAYKETEEKVTKKTAEFLISSIKDNLKIDNVNDIDLLYDYIQNSKLLDGKRKYKFYYKDDVIDISRSDGSILINSVYQAKLLAFLMHNNIVTKIIKGRDREIFTVNMGASASVAPYLNAAMDSLAASNDGVYRALSGPMSKILNPQLNSTIIIPNQEGSEKFISADIIQGQDVDMDMDIIKFLQNNIITSYGVDPGIIDLVNNNIDFAKSLTMLNKEMLILNINEQMDLIGGFSKLILAILYEEGSDSLRESIDAGKITVELYKPKSLLLEVAQNEINSAKSFAEIMVELSPVISSISNEEEDELTKKIAIYEIVQDYVSDDFAKYDKMFEEAATLRYQEYVTQINLLKKARKTKTVTENSDLGENEEEMDNEEV